MHTQTPGTEELEYSNTPFTEVTILVTAQHLDKAKIKFNIKN